MANFNEVFKVLENVLLDLKDFDEDEISRETTFEELDLDSLDFIEIQVIMKKEFKVSMTPDAFTENKISTLGELCNYLVSLKAA